MSSEVAALSRVHDRVLATDNDKLPQILEKLLPGLLPLANKEELRPQVLVIISNLVRRIKALRTPLPCPTLLTKLVTPDMMPFACNITLTLLDIALSHEPVGEDGCRGQQCTEAVLAAMALFFPPLSPAGATITASSSYSKSNKVFTMQLNSLLNYALELLVHVPAAVASSCKHTLTLPLGTSNTGTRTTLQCRHHLELLWDFLLDLSLATAPLIKDALGSVQPGLSQQRVQRLCHRARPCSDSNSEPSTGWSLLEFREVSGWLKWIYVLSLKFEYIAIVSIINYIYLSVVGLFDCR